MTFNSSETAVTKLGGMMAQDAKNSIQLTENFLHGFLENPIVGAVTHDVKSILLHFLQELIASGVHIVEGELPADTVPIVTDLEKWVDAYLTKLITGAAAA